VIWPRDWTLANIQSAISNGFLLNIGNSLLIAAVTVVGGLAISAMSAFALAVIPFRGRSLTFSAVVLSFLVPFEAIAIPLSQTFGQWGLSNTLIALVLPGLGNGLAVFNLRQFFLGVPASLTEAATLDGAGWFRIFWSVYLPLSRPALVGSGLILFLFQWQAYLWPVLVVSSQQLDLAPVAIAKSFGAFSSNYGQVFAETAVLAIIPAVVLLALQRYFVASITVLPGANRELGAAHVTDGLTALRPGVVLAQCEIPMAAVAAAYQWCTRNGARFVLNPSPLTAVPPEIAAGADLLILNVGEARALAGLPPGTPDASAPDAGTLVRALLARTRRVVITTGSDGAYIGEHGAVAHIPGKRVRVVDTTGAGDEFAGVLAGQVAHGQPLAAAAAAANHAAARIAALPRTAR
jgi:multiple sugar transport system permease protein/putative chitobiose transport system permease protein